MSSASGKLEILKAHYGCNTTSDVTDKCRKIAAENNGAFIVDGKTDFNVVFGDPEPGKSKKLTLLYRYGEGYQQQQMWEENHGFINLVALSLTNGGVLTLNVHKAADLRDSRTFGTQNPYAELSCGGEKFTTKVHDKGGKNPVWGQIFTFNLDGKDQYMHVFIKDKELGTDTVIGRLDIHLPVLCAAKGEVAYPVIHPNDFKKQCGTIVLTAAFVDKTAPTKAAETTAPAAAAAAAAAPAAMAVSPQPQVIYQQPQPQVIYQQPQPQPQPQVVYQQPQVVYQQPVVQQPQVVYQQPVVQQQPQVVYVPAPAPAPAPAPVVQSSYIPNNVPRDAVPGNPGGSVCYSSSKQDGWRWCKKCMNMCYSGLGSGVCVAGGSHDYSGSGRYNLNIAEHSSCGTQENWRWCKKCQSLTFGQLASVCAAGGAHDHSGSGNYHMCLKAAHGQVGWAWCQKCGAMFYGASGFVEQSKCAVGGGNHDQRGSGSYQMAHD